MGIHLNTLEFNGARLWAQRRHHGTLRAQHVQGRAEKTEPRPRELFAFSFSPSLNHGTDAPFSPSPSCP
jgi:hypothetical protein